MEFLPVAYFQHGPDRPQQPQESENMKLKTIEVEGQTYAVIQDGKPVYVDDSGKETPFDAVHVTNKVAQLNHEAMSHRKEKEALETKVSAFGDLDPEAAKKALETVANIDAAKLIDAGKAEEVKTAAVAAVQEQMAAAVAAKDEEIATITGERDTTRNQLHSELIGGGFARSKFVQEKIAIPYDMVETYFSKNFKVEDGAVKAYGSDGSMIYSKQRPGDPAGFDEALEILVDNYPNKDYILKGTGKQGPGAGSPGNGQDGKTMTRAQYDAMSHSDRAAKMADGFSIVSAD